MRDEMKKVPRLRFRGFQEDWELCKLGELIESFDSERIPIDSSLRISGQYPYYGATGIIDYIDSYIFDGEYVLLAEDGANIIMRNYPVAYLTQGKFWLNNHAHIMRMVKGDNQFLVQILEKMNYSKYNTGTAQPKLNSNIVKRINLRVPIPEEQQKIGTLFKQLDDTITLHQRKLDQLKELKTAYLQVIFPVKDERVPKLRFADFEEEWELCKLGDLANIVGGGTPNTNNPKCWDGNIDWYAPAEIKEKIYVTGSKKRITELGLQKSSAKVLPIGTVLFTSRAGIGNTAILAKKGTTNQGFQSIIPNKNKLDTYFIFSRTHELKKYGEAVGAGSTFVEVSGKQMAKMPMLTPRFNEQQAIGMFFKKIDDIITLHQNKLEQLKDLKTSYLQNMFI
ncbi:restriction endonuclease subunit S [Enterococcus faecalis]|nr:restriction endonuclease subunit S [Enterococcus faecalis]MRJ29024.1 restriction endonuclease subunit S [Enterococcus faecalis]